MRSCRGSNQSIAWYKSSAVAEARWSDSARELERSAPLSRRLRTTAPCRRDLPPERGRPDGTRTVPVVRSRPALLTRFQCSLASHHKIGAPVAGPGAPAPGADHLQLRRAQRCRRGAASLLAQVSVESAEERPPFLGSGPAAAH